MTGSAIPFADDPDAWRRHDGFVRRLAARLLRDEDAADDVAQEVWMRALRRGPRAPAAWLAWLRRVAARLAQRHARGEGRRKAREAQVGAAAAAPTPDEIRAREEVRSLVIDAVLALREPYRETVVLHHLEELPLRAIAARQSVPLETVRTRLRRALEQLRAELRARRGEEWRAALGLLPLVGRAERTSAAFGGWILVQHKVKVAAAVIVAAALWVWWSVNGAPALAPAAPPAPPMVSSPALAAVEPDAMPAAQRSAAAVPVPAGTCELRVRVVWHDGSPAAGVAVEIDPLERGLRELVWQAATTGADGEVRFHGVPSGRVAVGVPGRKAKRTADVIAAGAAAEILVELESGQTLRGSVVDERGDPVADALILIESSAFHFGIEVGRSDGRGRFALRDLGFAVLGARKPGYAPSWFYMVRGRAGGELDLRLTLPATGGGAVEGRVVSPAGRPAAGALVIVGERQWFGTGQPDGGSAKPAPPVRVVCDAEGRFRADAIPAGRWPVRVSHASGSPWLGEVEVASGAAATVVVALQPSATVVGTARGDDGQPLADVWVQLASRPVPRNPGPYFVRVTRGAPDGTFRLEQLPIGEVVLRATHAGHAPALAVLQVEPGQVLAWDPRLTKGRTVIGRIVDESGAPVRHAHVEVSIGGQGSPMYTTDREGCFAIPHVVADSFDRFTVIRDGPGVMVERVSVADVRIPTDELTVTVPARPTGQATIRGRVVDGAGRPIGHALIHVRGSQAPIEPPDATGGFTRQVPPGSYAIQVTAMGFAHLDVGPRLVRDGETWDAGELSLGPPAQVVVHARLAPGLSWPAAQVRSAGEQSAIPIQARLVDAEGRQRAWGVMREPGRIEFTAVAAGRYRCLVIGDEFASEPVEVVAEAGASREAFALLVRGIRHDFRATFAARPLAAEVEVLDGQGFPLLRVPLVVPSAGPITASCRLAIDRCTARLRVDGETTTGAALEHDRTR